MYLYDFKIEKGLIIQTETETIKGTILNLFFQRLLTAEMKPIMLMFQPRYASAYQVLVKIPKSKVS